MNCKARVIPYSDIERRNRLAEAMESGSTGKVQYHIVSVACAWDQRSYSASIDGFYLGYHAAVAILEEIEPESFPGTLRRVCALLTVILPARASNHSWRVLWFATK